MSEVKRTSRVLYRYISLDGIEVKGFVLYNGCGAWLGYATLESNSKEQWGRLYTVTDYGNYSYMWDAIGKHGFDAFLLSCHTGYITDKLSYGHDEARVLDCDATREEMREILKRVCGSEDPDWIGERDYYLNGCESEADFLKWAEEGGMDDEDVYEHFKYTRGRYLKGYESCFLPELSRMLRAEPQNCAKDKEE